MSIRGPLPSTKTHPFLLDVTNTRLIGAVNERLDAIEDSLVVPAKGQGAHCNAPMKGEE